ncbi:spondin domain-containing protein [bacterium]|nr:spondin domain-containing protein [bacterium]
MGRHTARVAAVAALGAFFVSCSSTDKPAPSSKDAAVYEMKFQGTWTKANHPTDYPEGSSLNPNAAHFSGIIGAPHKASYSIFKEGGQATPGLMALSHKGSKSPLDEEIKAAAAAGNAGEIFDTGVFLDVTSPKTVKFEVSDKFPLVSFVAMIAPSPDWFVGLSNVDLKDGGKWVDSKTMEAQAWDSGTYEGTTYMAEEKPTTPHKPTAPSEAPPFVVGGKRPPIATVTFTRQK